MYRHQTLSQIVQGPPFNAQAVRSFLVGCAILMACVLAFVARPVAAHSEHVEGVLNADAMSGLILDETFCGVNGYRIEGTELCAHGSDAAPQGHEDTQSVASANATHSPILCDGDGVSGKRVQVLYARAEDMAGRFDAYLEPIRGWAADADAIFDASAHETGGHRHIRFVTNADCEIDVHSVVLPASADDSLSATVAALRTLGYNDATRKYLIFMDASRYCGIASVVNDSSAGAQNRSNLITGYARVDNGCWDGFAIAHELTHTLGGIQNDAPNASGGWHCVDENDVMCYSDAPYYPTLRVDCGADRFNRLLDCNHDDYFHTSPPVGSYLATHWNVADNDFLINTPDDHAALPEVILETESGEQQIATVDEVIIEIELPTASAAVQRVEFFHGEMLAATLVEGPFRYTWQADTAGVHTFAARVYDQHGYSVTLAPLTVVVVDSTVPVAVDDLPAHQQFTFLPLIIN